MKPILSCPEDGVFILVRGGKGGGKTLLKRIKPWPVKEVKVENGVQVTVLEPAGKPSTGSHPVKSKRRK